jgi:hypothetical protein
MVHVKRCLVFIALGLRTVAFNLWEKDMDHRYQERYWTQLKHLKTHIFYCHFYALHTDKIDKGLNIFLALTSSGSIAAWAVVKDHAMLWACIIAASQIVTAIKPFLPYRQRAKALIALGDALQKGGSTFLRGS